MKILKRRRTTAKTIAHAQKFINKGPQWLLCSKCLADEVLVGADVSSVICADCVQRLVPAPEVKVPKKIAEGHGEFPRGWHLRKRYVAPDGTVYERGKPAGENNSTGTKSDKPAAKSGRPRGRPKRGSAVPTTAKRPRGRPRKHPAK